MTCSRANRTLTLLTLLGCGSSPVSSMTPPEVEVFVEAQDTGVVPPQSGAGTAHAEPRPTSPPGADERGGDTSSPQPPNPMEAPEEDVPPEDLGPSPVTDAPKDHEAPIQEQVQAQQEVIVRQEAQLDRMNEELDELIKIVLVRKCSTNPDLEACPQLVQRPPPLEESPPLRRQRQIQERQ